MKIKKLLSVIIAVVMVMQMLPVFANETVQEVVTENMVSGLKYYVNDQFEIEGDTSGWAKGSVKSGTQTFDVTQGTAPDGTGALIFTAEGDKGVADGGNEPNIFKELGTKIPLNEGKTIVIKTRFMQAGNGEEDPSGISYLRFNQPNDEYLLSKNNIPYSYPNMTTEINNANAICDWFTLLKMEKSGLSYRTQNGGAWAPTKMATDNTVGKWIDATITINSNTSVKIEANIDGTTYTKDNGSLIYSGNGPLVSYTLYNDPTATTALTEYPSLDSLTWVSQTKNTVYVDYVQVYENTKLEVTPVNTTIFDNGAFSFEIADADDKTAKIEALPEGVVTIDGVEATESYDSETGILTLAPITALTAGNIYTATVNTALLEEAGFIYTGEASFEIKVEKALPEGFYLDDQFETAGDTNGWAKGSVKSGTQTFDVTQGTAPDGTGALIFTAEGDKGVADGGNEPNIFKELGTKIPLNEGKTIIIKTRFMQAGNGEEDPSGISYLRFNQPNDEYLLSKNNIPYSYPNMTTNINNANAICDWFTLLKMEKSGLSYRTQNGGAWAPTKMATDNTVGKWIDATITINSNTSVKIEANIDGTTYTKDDGSLIYGGNGPLVSYTLYNDPTATTALTEYPSLDSLTWVSQTKNTVYVDYIQVYEPIKPKTYNAVAVMPAGSTIGVDEAFEVKFIATNDDGEAFDLAEIPEGAVTVEGVATTNTFDAETQVLTLTPEALTEGTIYNVVIDKEILAEENIIYNGTEAFSITARGARSTGYVINDNFAEDTDGWEVGPAAEGFTTTTEVVTDNGAVDGKALKITFPAKSGSNASNYGTVTKAVGNGIEFTNGKTVTVETRVKKTSTSGDYNIRLNRPNTLNQIFGDYVYTHYFIAKYDPNPGYPGVDIIGSVKGNDVENNANAHWRTSDSELTDKWVTYKFEFTPADGYYYTEVSYTDENGNEVVMTSNQKGLMKAAKAAIDEEYGVGYYKTLETNNTYDANNFFKALERLTFSSNTGGDVYVDYVKVYESASAKAQLLNGKRIENNDSIKLQFISEREIEEIPADAVTVSGVTVSSSYDKETQILTLTPADDLTVGEEYVVTIDGSKLKDGIVYEGTKTFNVKAISPRTTDVKTVVNETFDDETIEGWIAGAANEGFGAILTPYTDGEDKVLKVVMPKAGDDTNGGKQGYAHFELPEGIKYEEGKVTVIKARVKNVTNAPYMIQINRVNELTQPANIRQLNGYSVAGQATENGVKQLVFGTNTLYTYANGNQWKAMLPFNHDANKNKFSFANVDLANKWVEWEIVIDGTTNKMNVTAKYDDTVLTTWATENPVSALNPAQVLGYEYGIGTDIKTFSGFDSISFATNDTSNEATLYIDYVTVENKKDRASAVSALTVNGNEVKTFVTGDVVVPQFTVDPSISDSYTAVSVMYVDGIITEMYTEEIESENANVHTIVSENSFVVPENENVVIKAFLWNTFETMDPIGTMAEASKSDNITVYVSASGNDDSGTGEVNSPVATLKKGLEIAKSRVAAVSGYDGSVTIEMADGTYDVSDTVVVNKATTKIPAGGLFITNAEGAKPVISGGTKFDIKDAVKVTDPEVLGRLNSTEAANNLYVMDLTDINVPSESWPGVKSFGVEALAEAADGIVVPDIAYQVSMNGTLMVNSRWPNEGYTDAKTVSGNTSKATSENIKNGFTLGCTNTNDWSKANDALIFAFLSSGWATQTTPLAGKANGTVTSKYAAKNGVSATHARYYVYNLLEEIDTPYEYYIDRSVTPNKMYFYKPSDVTQGTIAITTEQKELLNIFSVSNVTVSGLTFENALGSAVSISQGHSNKIKNCEFKNMIADIDSIDNNAVLNVFSKNCVVDNNHIYNTNGGIKVGSDTPEKDIKTLAGANNTISNNHIENYGILDKVYVDAINCMGIGNNILNNEIHNAEHLAMRISGFNHNIQYNEIYDVCKETEDVGAIYMGHTWTSRGNKIVNNYFHDIKSTLDTSVPGRNSIAAIFLDDHFAGAYIEGNIFADITGDGVRSNRGREGYFNNNLFVNCTRHGIALPNLNEADSVTSEGNYQEYLDNVWTIQNSISDGSYSRDIWMAQFPEFVNTNDEDWVKPEKFTVTNNIAVNTLSGWDGKTLSAGQWIKDLATKIENNEQTTTDPGFNDISNDYTIDILNLKDIVSSFIDVQFEKMGRNK